MHPRATPLIHHATSPRPRSPRRAAAPWPKEPTISRCALPPPRDASIGRPRVNHARVHLVNDRLPHEASGCRHRRAHYMPCPGKSKSRHGRLALLPHSSCAAHTGTRSPSTSPQTTAVQAPLWSLQMALKQHRALPGSTDGPYEPTREHHHATSPPPRSPRRAATPLALEHTLQRCAPSPPRCASIGRPRVNHTRVHLVQDRLPHVAHDADAVTAAPTTCHIKASQTHGTACSPSFRTPAAPLEPACAVSTPVLVLLAPILPRVQSARPLGPHCGRPFYRALRHSARPAPASRGGRAAPPAY